MKILIADDHELVGDVLARFLERECEAQVLSAATLGEAVAVAQASGPFDLVLLDWRMPGMEGLEGLTAMKEANGGQPVALMSGVASMKVVREAIKLGAAGFVPKILASTSLASAVRLMVAGEVFLPVTLMQEMRPPCAYNLTNREVDVLRGVCEGKPNKGIARDLGLQEVTVKLHVKTLCRKFEVANRTHAAMKARDLNLF